MGAADLFWSGGGATNLRIAEVGPKIAFDAAFDGKQSVGVGFDQRRLALSNPKKPHDRPSAARDGKVREDGVVRDRAVLIADGRGLNAQCVAAVLFPAGSQ